MRAKPRDNWHHGGAPDTTWLPKPPGGPGFTRYRAHGAFLLAGLD